MFEQWTLKEYNHGPHRRLLVCICKNIVNCSKNLQFLPVVCALCMRCAWTPPKWDPPLPFRGLQGHCSGSSPNKWLFRGFSKASFVSALNNARFFWDPCDPHHFSLSLGKDGSGQGALLIPFP